MKKHNHSIFKSLLAVCICLSFIFGSVQMAFADTDFLDTIEKVTVTVNDFLIENYSGVLHDSPVEWFEYDVERTNPTFTFFYNSGTKQELDLYDFGYDEEVKIITDQTASTPWGVGKHSVKVLLPITSEKTKTVSFEVEVVRVVGIDIQANQAIVEDDYKNRYDSDEYDIGLTIPHEILDWSVRFNNGQKIEGGPKCIQNDPRFAEIRTEKIKSIYRGMASIYNFPEYIHFETKESPSTWKPGKYQVKAKAVLNNTVYAQTDFEIEVAKVTGMEFVPTENLVENFSGSSENGYFHYDIDKASIKCVRNFSNGETEESLVYLEEDGSCTFHDYEIKFTDTQSPQTPWGLGRHEVKASVYNSSDHTLISKTSFYVDVVALEETQCVFDSEQTQLQWKQVNQKADLTEYPFVCSSKYLEGYHIAVVSDKDKPEEPYWWGEDYPKYQLYCFDKEKLVGKTVDIAKLLTEENIISGVPPVFYDVRINNVDNGFLLSFVMIITRNENGSESCHVRSGVSAWKNDQCEAFSVYTEDFEHFRPFDLPSIESGSEFYGNECPEFYKINNQYVLVGAGYKGERSRDDYGGIFFNRLFCNKIFFISDNFTAWNKKLGPTGAFCDDSHEHAEQRIVSVTDKGALIEFYEDDLLLGGIQYDIAALYYTTDFEHYVDIRSLIPDENTVLYYFPPVGSIIPLCSCVFDSFQGEWDIKQIKYYLLDPDSLTITSVLEDELDGDYNFIYSGAGFDNYLFNQNYGRLIAYYFVGDAADPCAKKRIVELKNGVPYSFINSYSKHINNIYYRYSFFYTEGDPSHLYYTADGFETLHTIKLPDGANAESILSVDFCGENQILLIGEKTYVADASAMFECEKTPVCAHEKTKDETIKPATATEEGTVSHKCLRCGHTFTTATPVLSYPGDVSGDGEVTAEDARLALRAAVGLETYEKGSAEFLAADASHDGEITSEDARLILRAAVGLETLT